MTKPTHKPNIISFFCCLLLIFVFADSVFANQNQARAVSRVLSNAGLRKPNLNSSKKPKITSLSDATVVSQLQSNRFCLETYMSRGGRDGSFFVNSDSKEIGQVIRTVDSQIETDVTSERYVQGTLFGAFLYIKKLYDEENYKGVSAGARRVRRQSYWNNNYLYDTEVDQLETGTYYRIPTIQKLIRLNEYKAILNGEFLDSEATTPIESGRYRKLFQMFLEYFDHKSAFDCVEYLSGEKREHLEAYFMGTTGPQLSSKYFDSQLFLDAFPALARQLSELTDWQVKEVLNKYPEIAGFASNEDFIDIYLGRSRLYLVRVDKKSGEVLLYDEKAAGNIFHQYAKEEIRKNSSESMNLVSILPFGKKYKLVFAGKEISLTQAELAKLRQGLQLPDSHALSIAISNSAGPTVVWSNPFTKKSGFVLRSVESLIHLMQKSYPNAAIFLDDFRKEETERKASQLYSFRTQKQDDVYAVIDQSLEDDNIINNLADTLTSAKIRVIRYYPGLKWTGGQGKALFVITGHINPALANIIRKLGEDGYFKGNYVLLNSCRTKLTTELVTEINQRYGAIATLQHEGAITPVDVEEFLVSFSEKFGEQREFREIIMESLKQNNLSAIWVICKLTYLENYLHPRYEELPAVFPVTLDQQQERTI